MKSLSDPNMFSNKIYTNVIEDKEATFSNLRLLILSERNTLFGDPYFGVNIRSLFFDQITSVLADILIDNIYTAILNFMPQIRLLRNNITLESDNNHVYISVKFSTLLNPNIDIFTMDLVE